MGCCPTGLRSPSGCFLRAIRVPTGSDPERRPREAGDSICSALLNRPSLPCLSRYGEDTIRGLCFPEDPGLHPGGEGPEATGADTAEPRDQRLRSSGSTSWPTQRLWLLPIPQPDPSWSSCKGGHLWRFSQCVIPGNCMRYEPVQILHEPWEAGADRASEARESSMTCSRSHSQEKGHQDLACHFMGWESPRPGSTL